MDDDLLDLAGVGIGPSNLSLAALLHGTEGVRARFFDRRAAFAWHPGLMFPAARMQTSFLKDLVTAVDPTSPFTFVNYLVQHGRFYPFLARERPAVPRHEFADYLGWVARALPELRFGVDVRGLTFEGDGFALVDGEGRTHRARHLCVGTGRSPHVPACARPHLGTSCFHAFDILQRDLDLRDRTVAVVGGGQTGAEIVLELLRARWGAPRHVHWISRRPNYEPLDESPFTNHLFTPAYVRRFRGLPARARAEVLAAQRLAGDGISHCTLEELHDAVYDRLAVGHGSPVTLLPGRELVGLDAGMHLRLHHRTDDSHEAVHADVVVLCTGFDDRIPACLEGLAGRLALDDGQLAVGPSFAVAWDGPPQHRIYVVNAARHAFGIAESQLSLMAWRSAVIVNDLVGRPRFPTDAVELVRWAAQPIDGARA